MKTALALLFILGSAAVIFSAVDLSHSDSVTITGSARPVTGGFGIDTKNIEARIAELRSDAESYSNSMEDEDGEFINTGNVKAMSPGSRLERSLSVNPLSNSTSKDSLLSGSIAQNGTANTTTLNASAANASALAPTAIKGSEIPRGSNLGSEDASSSSQAAAKSLYNTSTSRQGMGNSAIKSSMSLKGDFEVQKSGGF